MRKRMSIILALSMAINIVPAAAAPPQTGNVNVLQETKRAKQSEVEKVKNDIVKKSAEIMELNEELVRIGEQRIAAEKELEEAKKYEAEQEECMRTQIVYMYENGGGTNFIENIIESKSMSEFVNRIEYASEVHSYNKKQLEKYKQAKKRVAESNEALKAQEEELKSKQSAAEAKESELQHIYDVKQAEIAEVEDEIQAEIRRIAAEEAARKAREEAERKEKARQKAAAAAKRNAGSSRRADNSLKRAVKQPKRNVPASAAEQHPAPTQAVQAPAPATQRQEPKTTQAYEQPAAVTPTQTVSEPTPKPEPKPSPKPETQPAPQPKPEPRPANDTNTVSAQNAILAAARSQLGVPYVWGGTTPGSGLDCSGLVQYCYRQAGISLPRVSEAQGGVGTRTDNPQPGDMVCYGHHIGIYIGSGQMIHAPKPGEVVTVVNVYGNPWYMHAW